MRADKVLTATAAIIATAAVALTTVPSAAQTTTDPPVVRRAHVAHPPARVTVHRRSYLDPGTETKRRAEHGIDYYHSPIHGMAPMRNSTLFLNGPALPLMHDRMPFPNCLDLPGFCN
jgi:hypothetical protein